VRQNNTTLRKKENIAKRTRYEMFIFCLSWTCEVLEYHPFYPKFIGI